MPEADEFYGEADVEVEGGGAFLPKVDDGDIAVEPEGEVESIY